MILLVYPSSNHPVKAKTTDPIKISKGTKYDTFKEVSLRYGLSKSELKGSNEIIKELVTEKKVIIQVQLSEKEKDLLARLVTAEAKGEPYKGKVAVAAVVLNRVDSEQFPDSIQQVIYQEKQFQPVDNGMINKPAGIEARKAVNEAIANDGQITDALYFFNPDQTNSKWLRTRDVTEEIGNHRFAI